MTHPLPISAQLAWWGTSWLRGHISPDELIDALRGDAATHLVTGLPPDGTSTTSLLIAVASLRSHGAGSIGAAFPAEGDPVGLGGPAGLNRSALEAGEAVVAAEAGLALVPEESGDGWHWRVEPAHRRPLADVGETDRALRAALLDAANGLADLDVARWRPEVADELMDLRRTRGLTAPRGVPPRCVELAARAWQALGICAMALEDDGGAVTAAEATLRRDTLLPLERAGRRALTAACSPEVWPEA